MSPADTDVAVELADRIARAPRPVLLGLDIDGVLAPIVAHADDAVLLAGVDAALERICSAEGVVVAAVSGRGLASMLTFGLPVDVRLTGSHGMEVHGRPMTPLDVVEQARFDRLHTLSVSAASDAGEGAWVESKVASVAVHIREADPDLGAAVLSRLAADARLVDGATSKPGTAVLELFARHASKGTAIGDLRAATGARTVVFVGDDLTDEEAFAVLGPDDVSIKVGDAPTVARSRLRDPHHVLRWLELLADRLQRRSDQPTSDQPTSDEPTSEE